MRPGELHWLRVTCRAYTTIPLNSSALGTICNEILRNIEAQVLVIRLVITHHALFWLEHFVAFRYGAYVVLILD